MKTLSFKIKALTILSVALVGFAAIASEFSRPLTDDGEDGESVASNVGKLTPSSAQALFGEGRIPSLEHLDNRYKQSGTSAQCREAWNVVRRRNIEPKEIRPNLSALLAKASRMGISTKQLKKTLAVFLANQSGIPNQETVSIIDYNKSGGSKRLFIINLRTGEISAHLVSAGRGSDTSHSGYATRFSNRGGTNASSVGCFLAAGVYDGGNGRSLMLHGFESSNDNSCDRSTIMHAALKYPPGTGRSNGCLAVPRRERAGIFKQIGSGGLICAYKDGEIKEASLASRHRYRYGHSRRGFRHAHRRHRHHYARN